MATGTDHLPKLKTCTFCKREGFVWYFTRRGQWMLAEPYPGTMTPDPLRCHFKCGAKAIEKTLRKISNGSVGKYGTRSGKVSTYRRKSRRR